MGLLPLSLSYSLIEYLLQPSVGHSPFQLLYGREPSLPIHSEFNLPSLARFRDAKHYLSEVRQAQCEAVELVEQFMAMSQARQLYNYRPAVRDKYSVGDQVLLHNPALHHGSSYKLARTLARSIQGRRNIGQSKLSCEACYRRKSSGCSLQSSEAIYHPRHSSLSDSASVATPISSQEIADSSSATA